MKSIFRPRWYLSEKYITPENMFNARRDFMKKTALITGVSASGILGSTGVSNALFGFLENDDDEIYDNLDEGISSKHLYPAQRNEKFADAGREMTVEKYSARYNNFYEFGSHKEIAKRAQDLKSRPWQVEISGLVEKPQAFDVDDLIIKMGVEERVYRHRCVEAWSMVVPWSGFPLSRLVKQVAPHNDAKYVVMKTFQDKNMAPGHKQDWYPWPYTEVITIQEAMNDLSFMVTGAYGKPLHKQFGAPLRLALPWKYGFKSIKSIVSIEFTKERPKTFWEEIAPTEYGFWANVNPDVPHPRWSQATERVLGTDDRIPTQIYNGYGDEVANLYKNRSSEKLFM